MSLFAVQFTIIACNEREGTVLVLGLPYKDNLFGEVKECRLFLGTTDLKMYVSQTQAFAVLAIERFGHLSERWRDRGGHNT